MQLQLYILESDLYTAATAIRTREWFFTLQRLKLQLYILESDFSHCSFSYTYWRVTFYTAAFVVVMLRCEESRASMFNWSCSEKGHSPVCITGEWPFTRQLQLYVLERVPLHYSFSYTYWSSTLLTAASVIHTGMRFFTLHLQLYILENHPLHCSFSYTYWRVTLHTAASVLRTGE